MNRRLTGLTLDFSLTFSSSIFLVLTLITVLPNLVKAQEIVSPYPLTYTCNPYRDPFVDGGYYLHNGYCSYVIDQIPASSPYRYGAVYRGTIGSSTNINGHLFFDTGTQYGNGDNPSGALQGEDFFTTVSEPSAAFETYFTQGGLPPNQNYGFVRWKWGVEPPPPTCTENCYSNVLFLPGIKGSRLVEDSTAVWPPSISTVIDDTIEVLDVNDQGESVNDLKVDGIVNTFFGTPIYSGFTAFMDSLTAVPVSGASLINEWKPFAYDWRFSPAQVIEEGVDTPSGHIDPIAEVERLAQNSRTGKVTIVAHSMGGLVGKALIKKLVEQGKGDLVDSFVMVGTPQLGTPETVSAMLHGDGQGIPGGNLFAGVIVNPQIARQVSLHFESAYDLLPSQRYFQEVAEPVVTFDTNASFTESWRNAWGNSLTNYLNFFAFVSGGNVTRTKPAINHLHIPEILDPTLLFKANQFHQEFDNFQFPEAMRVVQVAGWGVPTIKTVNYKNWHFLFSLPIPSYETIPTIEGDSTVVYPSAISSVADETYYFHLRKFRLANNKNTQHRDLLNETPIQNAILSIVKNTNVSETEYLLSLKPDTVAEGEQLILSSHSPVITGVYDDAEDFTGINPGQNENSQFLTTSENIPGSTFHYSAGDEYIFLPKGKTYTFKLEGTNVGVTTLQISNFSNDVVTPLVTYTDFPVAAASVATIIVPATTPEDPHIQMDFDGNGQVDTIIASDTGTLSLGEMLLNLKNRIQSLETKEKLKSKLLKKVESIEKKIEKQKTKKASKIAMNLEKKISRKALKGKITDAEAEELLDLLEQIEQAL